MASWKPKHVAAMFLQLIIFYVIELCWTASLYILLMKESIADGREHYLPSPRLLSLCLSLSLNMHYQFAIVFSTLHVRNEPHSIKVGAQVDVRECILSALGCCFNCWTTDCCSLSCGMKLTAHFDGRKKRKSDGDNSRLFAANMSTTSGSLAI